MCILNLLRFHIVACVDGRLHLTSGFRTDSRKSAGARVAALTVLLKLSRIVEVENEHRPSFNFGEWVDVGDRYWALRVQSGEDDE